MATPRTAEDILNDIQNIILGLTGVETKLDFKADAEADIMANSESDLESDVVESEPRSSLPSDSESDDGLPCLSGKEMAKYIKTTNRKPSIDISNWNTSSSINSGSDSPATPPSSLEPYCGPIETARIEGGFRPLANSRKLDDKDVEALLIGSFNGNEVIHIVTGIEKFLNNAATMTSIGRRFLPEDPDKLNITKKDESKADSKAKSTEAEPVEAKLTETELTETETTEADPIEADPAETDPTEIPEAEPCPEVVKPGTVEPETEIIGKDRYKQFFEIRESPVGGFGIFALRDLKRGEVILVEEPMLKTSSFSLMDDFRALDEESKQIYMSLHAFEDNNTNEIERIKRANGFQLDGGIAIFAIAARFNHGCGHKRNVKYFFDKRRNVMSFVVWHDVVPAGSELLVTYGGSPAGLFRTFGFRCNCGGCNGLSDEDVRRLRAEEMGIHLY